MPELDHIKLDPDNHLLLEQPLLRVPHELLRHNLKNAQRQIEIASKAITTTLDKPGKTHEEHLAAIDATLAKAQTLKRKLEALHAEEKSIHAAQRARLQHISDVHSIHEFTDIKYDRWSDIRLNRLLVDYMLRRGYTESATSLAKDKDIEPLADIEVFREARKIETALRKGELKEALSWCNDNKTSLKKLNNDLEMELRLQQVIEMRRSVTPGKELDAMIFARKHFGGDFGLRYGLNAAGLLAFPPDTMIEPYRSLYSPKRYDVLADMFTSTVLVVVALPSTPLLHIALSAGLSALKTPSCHSEHALDNTANTGASVCPICSTELNELARTVPYAHQTKSYIEDDPYVLPNGRVFGKARLEMLNAKLGTRQGYIRDPTQLGSGPEWEKDVMKKVFIS